MFESQDFPFPNMLGKDKVKCIHRDNLIPAKKLLMAQRFGA